MVGGRWQVVLFSPKEYSPRGERGREAFTKGVLSEKEGQVHSPIEGATCKLRQELPVRAPGLVAGSIQSLRSETTKDDRGKDLLWAPVPHGLIIEDYSRTGRR